MKCPRYSKSRPADQYRHRAAQMSSDARRLTPEGVRCSGSYSAATEGGSNAADGGISAAPFPNEEEPPHHYVPVKGGSNVVRCKASHARRSEV